MNVSSPEPCPTYWRPRFFWPHSLAFRDPPLLVSGMGRGWFTRPCQVRGDPAPQAWVPDLTPAGSTAVTLDKALPSATAVNLLSPALLTSEVALRTCCEPHGLVLNPP